MGDVVDYRDLSAYEKAVIEAKGIVSGGASDGDLFDYDILRSICYSTITEYQLVRILQRCNISPRDMILCVKYVNGCIPVDEIPF